MTNPEDEADTVERARRGDAGAFERLYRRYASPVYSLAFRMTGSAELAEDLTQEAFVLAWRKLSSFKGRCAFFSWLYTLSVRLFLRKAGRLKDERPCGFPVEELSSEQAAGNPAAGSPAWDLTDLWSLQDAIARLPPRTRAALVLFDIEGYGHAEIAALMGIREGTSKALLHRGRKQLERELTR